MRKIISYVLLLLFASVSASELKTIHYSPSDEIIFNPERGFSTQIQSGINSALINSLKAQKISVIHRIYTLPQFVDKPIPDSYLKGIERDFTRAREGGMKLVLRFSYTDRINGQDAALDTILIHIGQLEPILRRNADVIAYVEAGFIGAWGEWYYSSHGLNNTRDRRTVLYALLDALPEERAVVVRTPDYKRRILEDDTPLQENEAFSGSRKSRIGAHNDCFLADATDMGTYLGHNIEGDKNYLNQDNRYVPQGGETCSPSAYSDCGHALTDLARMHWSVLNKDYHKDVLAQWETEGCMDEIKKRLGYRFVLLQAQLADSVKPGGKMQIHFELANEGFASPFNPRLLEIIIRNEETKKSYRLETNVDPRFWQAGDTVNVAVNGGIPGDIEEGNYQVFLHLADPVHALRYRPEYAIRLANEEVWEDSTGYNRMLHSVAISNASDGVDYSGNLWFADFTKEPPPPPQETTIILDGTFDDWNDIAPLDVYPNAEFPGDALNDNVDLTGMWAANDADNLYLSYTVAGEIKNEYFYHVFIDADNDTSTGFHSGGSYMGADLMVENSSLWLYSGQNGEWAWTFAGDATSVVGAEQRGRVELAVDRFFFADAGLVNLLFNINDLNEYVADDYAPDAYTNRAYHYSFIQSGVDDKNAESVPSDFHVRIFPNPFNSVVFINFDLDREKLLSAIIYDIRGRLTKKLDVDAGTSIKLKWNGDTNTGKMAASGMYILRISTNKRISNSKLILLK